MSNNAPDYDDNLVFPPRHDKTAYELKIENNNLHSLLVECDKWIVDVQNHCYLGIGARFDKSIDLLTRIREVLK